MVRTGWIGRIDGAPDDAEIGEIVVEADAVRFRHTPQTEREIRVVLVGDMLLHTLPRPREGRVGGIAGKDVHHGRFMEVRPEYKSNAGGNLQQHKREQQHCQWSREKRAEMAAHLTVRLWSRILWTVHVCGKRGKCVGDVLTVEVLNWNSPWFIPMRQLRLLAWSKCVFNRQLDVLLPRELLLTCQNRRTPAGSSHSWAACSCFYCNVC